MRERTCPVCGDVVTRANFRYHVRIHHPEFRGRERDLVRLAVGIWLVKVAQVKALFGWVCLACGRTDAEARAAGRGGITIDHVVAVTEGGPDDISNWQPLCLLCNNEKGTTYIDFRSPAQRIALARLLGPCVVVVVGRMRWCEPHQKPAGHRERVA